MDAKASSSSGSSRLRASTVAHGSSLHPLILCQCCGARKVKQGISHTVKNPNRVYYKCPNHKAGGCQFWFWEDEYVEYLEDHAFLVEDEVVDVRQVQHLKKQAEGAEPSIAGIEIIRLLGALLV